MDVVGIVGLAVLLGLYVLIIAVGVIASRWFRHKYSGAASEKEIQVVAGRELGTCVGLFSLVATSVDGGLLNGTAESVLHGGLLWTVAPVGVCVGVALGGLMFARPMRRKRYLTMLDPFQERYGNLVTACLFVATLVGDVIWAASILAALGTSLSIIIGVNMVTAVIASAVVAVLYTLFGQMVAVAYTDVVQQLLVVLGLATVLPFALQHHAVSPLSSTADKWLGSIAAPSAAVWADLAIAMTLGSIPWNSYFQRVLSVRTEGQARLLSVAAGVSTLLVAAPCYLVGIVAASTDWSKTTLGKSPLDAGMASFTLPLVIHHLTPPPVAIMGLAAVSAAVMSSVDSAVLSSSSMFTYNIYGKLLRSKASQRELTIVLHASVAGFGALAAVIAIVPPQLSIYGLFTLAADIVFVVMLPQLYCILFTTCSNSCGALAGYAVGFVLRLGAGEPAIGLTTPLIKYPFYSDGQQTFPFRTFAMLMSIVTIVVVSALTTWLYPRLAAAVGRRSTSLVTRGSSGRSAAVSYSPWQVVEGESSLGLMEMESASSSTHSCSTAACRPVHDANA